MKWRKALSLLLAVALLATAALAAAETGDQELMNVTTLVKTTLELDTDRFPDYQGWSNEDVLRGKRWTLEWTGEGESLSITADAQGKVYSYTYNQAAEASADSYYYGGRGLNIPSLPEEQSAQALEAAQAFLDKVLTPGLETVELKNNSVPSLQRSVYRFSGEVKLNGQSSPISCSVSVRPGTLDVSRFWRSDEYSGYVGDIPSDYTDVSALQARRLLMTTLSMAPEYVLNEDGKTARVLYLPKSTDEYYVDGKSGALVNLTELRKELGGNNRYYPALTAGAAAPEEAAMDAGAGKYVASLTQAEKDGAAILQAAMSKEDLDRVLQNAWPELGLKPYTLSAANYSISEKPLEEGVERTSDDYIITCRLSYGRQTEKGTMNRFVTVDAKTGELKSVYSRHYYNDTETAPSVSCTAKMGEDKAAAFLKLYAGKNAGKMALSNSYDCRPDKGWEHSYTFSHTACGYFYYPNFATVGIDGTDGSVSSLTYSFDEDVELIDPGKKVVNLTQAITAYGNSLDVRYGYLEVPVSVGLIQDDLRPLLKQSGYNFVTGLKPGFVLAQPDRYIRGVDAVTGAVVQDPEYTPDDSVMTYSDLEGSWVKDAAEALAVYRVGFWGGKLRPADTLTQPEMLALLLSVDGYRFDLTTAGKAELDDLYSVAYSLRLVTPAQRDESKTLTRGELVKLLLDGAGYQKIAALEGIFRSTFSDSASIPAGEQGYAALAQGLGLVKGGSDGAYAGSRAATRAEAVAMLYQYMK